MFMPDSIRKDYLKHNIAINKGQSHILDITSITKKEKISSALK